MAEGGLVAEQVVPCHRHLTTRALETDLEGGVGHDALLAPEPHADRVVPDGLGAHIRRRAPAGETVLDLEA